MHGQSLMSTYVQWVLRNQEDQDPNGIDVRGEPKFNLPNGDVFSGTSGVWGQVSCQQI